MKSLKVSLEFDIDVPIKINKEEVQQTLKILFILHLFKTGKISSGKAAEMLGITKHEMLEIIHSEGIPYDYDKDGLELESKVLRNDNDTISNR